MADGVSYPPPDLTGLLSAIPVAATAMPPGVSDGGSTGNTPQVFAHSNHTHAGKTRKQIMPVSASGLFTWTYPTAFAAGVVPICNGIAKCPAGTTALVNVQLEGDPTNTQCVFRITVYQQSAVALIGLTILSLAAGTPANTALHLIALEP